MSATRIVGVCLALAASAGMADTLLIDSVQTAEQSASQRPSPGTSMERVEATFGAPSERRMPVGEPPIERWEYPGFVVYFEHDRVIHTVVRR